MYSNKIIKVRVKKTYPQLECLFKVGDELDVFSKLYDKDTLIVHGSIVYVGEEGKYTEMNGLYKRYVRELDAWKESNYDDSVLSDDFMVINKPVIAKRGTAKELMFQTKDGKIYSYNTNIVNFVGNKSPSELFEKI